MRALVAICAMYLSSGCTEAESTDQLAGAFVSETAENAGLGRRLGEWRIEVSSLSGDKYSALIYRNGESIATKRLVRCYPTRGKFFYKRSKGPVVVLCEEKPGRPSALQVEFFAYAESGIGVEAVRRKYLTNPRLVEEEGLVPGHPSLFEIRHLEPKYYAQIQGGYFAFRKIAP